MNGAAVAEPYGQVPNTVEDDQVRTQVSAYEDGNDYVYVLGTHVEDMYRKFSAGAGVAAWARQIVYLRPNRFVVYDRTTEGSASYDQYLAWHFPAAPVAGTAASGENRLDVTYNGQYAGAMTVVLPVNTTTTTIAQYPGSNPVKVWQVQVRPPNTNASQQWLTVFDLSTSTAAVAAASPVTVTQGAIVGVQLPASDANSVVISSAGAAGIPISGSIGYSVAAVAARHIITDLAPSTGYTVTEIVSGSAQKVSFSVGGNHQLATSSEGVLDFNLSTSGVRSSSTVGHFHLADQHSAGAGVPAACYGAIGVRALNLRSLELSARQLCAGTGCSVVVFSGRSGELYQSTTLPSSKRIQDGPYSQRSSPVSTGSPSIARTASASMPSSTLDG